MSHNPEYFLAIVVFPLPAGNTIARIVGFSQVGMAGTLDGAATAVDTDAETLATRLSGKGSHGTVATLHPIAAKEATA
jgi:hypothetical protein